MRCAVVLLLVPLLVLLCTASLAVAGDGSDDTRPSPDRRLMALFSELADAVANADPERCDQVAGSLESWTTSHADELAELAVTMPAYLETLPASELEALDLELGAHFEIIMGAAVVCGSHDGTLEALDAMEAVLAADAAASDAP